ncbi:MAG: heme exporter protein C [bacterium]|jgi:heme exporter protein C
MQKTSTIFGFIAFLALTIAAYLTFYWIPLEGEMGVVQKIMYVHVPVIWVSFIAFFIVFLCSVGYLWKREEGYDIVAVSAAEIGILFCALGLITGSIWGRPTWNTYWTWDSRLTTTLILFLIFVGYLLLRVYSGYGEQQARLSAVIGIIGFLDIPLIHYSVTWWENLHQKSTMFSKHEKVIDPSFKITLMISVASFAILFTYLLLKRILLEKNTRSLHKKLANLS